MGPTGEHRILQVHPTRRCNLRCLHCYSMSSPEERDALDEDLVGGAVEDASREGFTLVGVSGGEPLMYRPLRAVLETAQACGMFTTVTTNGMLLTASNLARLDSVTDLIAISLDGMPESHNRMRNSDRAFATMSSRLDNVRASGIPFGFIFTLTRYNVHELEWVASFAVAQGARLLQIHPLEEVGRARRQLRGGRPDETELGWALLETLRIQAEYSDRIIVHVDATTRLAIERSPQDVFASPMDPEAPLAELVSPLVLEQDGWVVPLQYGFPRAFALGNLKTERLATMAKRWRAEHLASYQEVCRATFDTLSQGASGSIFNWYEAVMFQGQASTLAGTRRVPAGD